MILKFSLLSTAAGVTLLSCSTTNAFCTVPSSSQRTRRAAELHSSLDQDWDNGDFLSSLSGGAQEIAEANAKYQALSESKAKMNEWRARQMQMQQQSSAPQNDNSNTINESGDYGPSPELLRKMMGESDDDLDQMRQQPAQQVQQSAQVQQAAVQHPTQPQISQQQQFYDANGNPVDAPMFYDANGNLLSFFPPPPQKPVQQMQPVMDSAQTIQQQQQLEQSIQPVNQATTLEPEVPSLEPVEWEPPLPSNPKTRGDEPRPQGFNADAYAVSNTADVYFAQLKQDSRVRKKAWLAGDRETANQVFTDPSVAEIKDSWVDNPYTKEKNIQEARAEIEGAVRMQHGDDSDSESIPRSSGISYKQKLEEVKAKRRRDGVV